MHLNIYLKINLDISSLYLKKKVLMFPLKCEFIFTEYDFIMCYSNVILTVINLSIFSPTWLKSLV